MRPPRLTLALASRLWPAVWALAAITGCASAPRTTRTAAADMQFVATEAAQQLADSAFLRARTASDPEIRLVPDSVENRSNERLSRVDQWAAVGRVLFSPGMQAMLKSRNVAVVLPPHREAFLRRYGVETPQAIPPADQPTHALRAVFSSVSRAGAPDAGPASERKDLFIMEYSIIDLAHGRVEWTGSVEFARIAHGLLVD